MEKWKKLFQSHLAGGGLLAGGQKVEGRKAGPAIMAVLMGGGTDERGKVFIAKQSCKMCTMKSAGGKNNNSLLKRQMGVEKP